MVTVNEKIEVLTMARDLIYEPSAWIQCYHATDSEGMEVPPQDSDAVCFCLEGAIIRSLTELGMFVTGSDLWEVNIEVMGGREDHENIARWNDSPSRTHREVLARLDATLERLEAQQNVEEGDND